MTALYKATQRLTQCLGAVILVATLSACASGIQKAEIPSTATPSDEIARLDQDINEGYAAHYDVLAPKEFATSQEYLENAKSDMKDGKKQEKILDDVAYARGAFNKTKEYSEERGPRLQGVLEARKTAIDAGAKDDPSLREQLKAVDDETREIADNHTLKTEKFNELQNRYMSLELGAIQAKQLADANARIKGAIRDGARNNTPNLLKRAELEATNAANIISANRHNPSAYQDAVNKANQSAALLVEVLATTKRGRETISEAVALEMVRSNHQMKNLQGQLGAAEKQEQQLTQQVSIANRKLSEAEVVANLDSALKKAQKEFSRDEAEVYRDGDKLLIRLKAMAFPSGKADLPNSSLALLAKVKDVAQDLNPQQVVVQGHTDSIGTSATNLELSQHRAESVANYLGSNGLSSDKIQAVGEGFKKPIASNKTKEGRAQNRRVDVIIVPSTTTSAQ